MFCLSHFAASAGAASRERERFVFGKLRARLVGEAVSKTTRRGYKWMQLSLCVVETRIFGGEKDKST